MKSCKDCKHWRLPVSEYGEIPGVGTCQAVVQYWDATEWTEDYDKRQLITKHAGKLAFVQDGSDYYASLKTMPTFGCVQWEAK